MNLLQKRAKPAENSALAQQATTILALVNWPVVKVKDYDAEKAKKAT